MPIHADSDFLGRRTCYQDLPSSGRRANTTQLPVGTTKKTCRMPNPPKVTARHIASRLPPQCFPMAGNAGFDWIPVGDSKVVDSYIIQQLIVVVLGDGNTFSQVLHIFHMIPSIPSTCLLDCGCVCRPARKEFLEQNIGCEMIQRDF